MDHVEIVREFGFESAHYLPNVPADHKCRRMHGHSFRVEVGVAGPIDEPRGWLMDFAEIDAAVRPIFEALDHRCLNEVDGLENPTSEVLARWIWRSLVSRLPGLASVTVHETCNARCVYRGPR